MSNTDTREALAALHEWMPLQEAMRLARIWTDDVDFNNASQWKAAIKVLSEEVAALASAPAAQPSAQGEAVAVEAVAEVKRTEDGLELEWLVEGGICALVEGCVLVMPHRPITGDDGSGEVFLASAPAAPAQDR